MLSLNKSKYLLLTLLIGFGFYNCKTQNLIGNESFEVYDSIDCGGGGFDNYSTFPVPHVVSDWYTFNSADYFNNVCNSGGYSVPNSYFGNNYAKQGNAYAGIATMPSTGGYVEYIYQHLSSPLQANKIYCISFYISRADRKEYAIKNIGAYFSISTPTMVSSTYINSVPQVINQTGFITDTITWTQIQGCFTAQGGEEYVTIGTFDSNGNTDTLYVGTNNPIPSDPPFAYYYIDNITLIDQLTVGLNEVSKETRFEVYPNPTDGMLNIELRVLNGSAFMEVYNSIGQQVFKEEITNQHSSFDLRHLNEGIYFVKISYPNGMSMVKKVIVNR